MVKLVDLLAQASTLGFMYVYILRSVAKNWNYVGITQDIDNRIQRHNSGTERSTKPYRPYRLLFVQETDDYTSARILEKFLKVRFNIEALLKLIGA